MTDRWSALAGVNGGYLLAICAQAMARELPLPHPLTVSAHFLTRARFGPADVRTEVLRVGRRHATAQASLVQDDKEVVRAIGTFADLDARRGRTLVLGSPPDLPAPDEAVDPLGGGTLPGLTIVDRVAYRLSAIPGWVRGEPSGDPRVDFWMRFKDGREPDPLALTFLVDAAAPAVLELGEASSSTMELTVHVRGRPAPGWLACRLATRYVIGGYHEEDMELWDSAGNLVAQSRQLAVLPRPRE